VPNIFFSQLLPQIERTEEFVVTLYFFFAQGRKRGSLRLLTEGELAADAVLLQTLANWSQLPPQDALRTGLALARERGTLLRAEVEQECHRQAAYLLNTPGQRRALSRLGPTQGEPPLPPAEAAPRPNIFALYEENIGALTPLIADDLRDAEARYPREWVAAAFREAVAMNKRSWRYIQAILQRWEAEGPDYETLGRDPQADRGGGKPLSGRYRHLVHH
jgi:DnaD/phage-associated family protein